MKPKIVIRSGILHAVVYADGSLTAKSSSDAPSHSAADDEATVMSSDVSVDSEDETPSDGDATSATPQFSIVVCLDYPSGDRGSHEVFSMPVNALAFDADSVDSEDAQFRNFLKPSVHILRKLLPYLPISVEHLIARKATPIKSLKEAVDSSREITAYFESELKAAQEKRLLSCPHPEDKRKIRQESYMEEGRMCSPVTWKEKYCSRCGKVLAKSSTEVTEIWTETD